MFEDAAVSRRLLLKGTAIAMLAGSAFVSADTAAAEEVGPREASKETQYGFLVDTGSCVNCGKCVKACRAHNKTPEGMPARRKVETYESSFGKKVHVSTGCMHCKEPACAQVCPAHAISKRKDGIVTVDPDRCIGCKYCFQACPFEVPHYGANGMDKCDCCLGARVPAGEEPHCVQACIFGGLQYGEVDELLARNHYTARSVEGSTGPSYLVL